MREGDNRLAIIAGILFMLVLSWVPPIGVIIAGFLIGFIAKDPRDGAAIAAVLALLGAAVQIVFLTKVVPILGLGITLLGFLPLNLEGFVHAFGPLAGIFLGLGNLLAGAGAGENIVTLLLLYILLGALGGFLGGLIK